MTGTKQSLIVILSGLAIMVASPVAVSGDGRLEINQTCAVNGGCFAGDDPGFPVDIAESGSYVLTSDLDVNVASQPSDTDAIDIVADDVTIDLNGFRILGPVTCTGTPVTSCTNTGSGRGVNGSSGTVVKNGSIRGMGDHGVFISNDGEAVNLRVIENGSFGVFGLNRSTVSDVNAYRNGDNGIAAWAYASIKNSKAIGNGTTGILPTEGSLVKDSVAAQNASRGILVRDNSSAVDNVARDNDGVGLDCFTTASVRGNVLANNSGGQVGGSCALVENNFCDGTSC